MSFVVDASVLVAATIDAGPDGVWAESIIADSPLVAPELVLVETANVLRRLERAGEISTLEATSAHSDVCSLDITLVPYHPFAERAWELRGHVSSYDAWYLAAAEAFSLPLATLDRRLSRTAGVGCRFSLPG